METEELDYFEFAYKCLKHTRALSEINVDDKQNSHGEEYHSE